MKKDFVAEKIVEAEAQIKEEQAKEKIDFATGGVRRFAAAQGEMIISIEQLGAVIKEWNKYGWKKEAND